MRSYFLRQLYSIKNKANMLITRFTVDKFNNDLISVFREISKSQLSLPAKI